MTRALGEGSLIAVVGMSCRLPRATDVAAYWGLLERGEDAISKVPDERWRLAGREPGEGSSEADPEVRFGAFLERVDEFDAAFFGVSPPEAAAMDPQQRLALELAWEAFEDAGVASALDGDPVGVFLGAIAGDYVNLVERAGADPSDPHTGAGLPRSIIANRVSHTLGLTGPSLTVDAGQAASLVAVHLACESLRRGESEIALAGGVHLNLDPQGAASGLQSNGCVRGEGGGLVVLKPLEKACADGDRLYCVIRGSAIGNDGPGEALAAPNRKAQEKVLKRAHRRSELKRSDIQYVELHGSGDALGDAVEAAALGAVLGSAGEANRPLSIGSVKTNLGHLEGAAGIAGLIKVALAIERRQIPASPNFKQPNPEIPLKDLGLRVQTELSGWPDDERPLVAGVSSFGPGGTNCHVVLAEVPAALEEKLNKDNKSLSKKDSRSSGSDPAPPLQGWMPLALSARSEEALCAQADRLASHLKANPDLDLDQVGFSLATRRAHLPHRAVCLGGDREECLNRLGALAKGRNARGVVKGVARAERPAVFVFAGQGSQWAGMAADLLDSSPVFARHIDECEQALEPFVDWSLGAVLCDRQAPWLDRIDIAQPAISMVSIALARLWQACGVEPSLVVGHSQGEIAAAHIAGALSLDDAALSSAVYAKTCLPLVGKGGMAAVSLPEATARQRLEKFGGRLSVAAVNGTTSVVVSGDSGPLEDFLGECASEGLFAQKIALDYACHSAQIEALEAEVLAAFAPVRPCSAEIPFHSTVTPGPLDTKQLDAGYWYKNLRQVVRLEPVIRALLEEAPRAFIEIGPHPVLAFGIQETIDAVLGVDDDRATVLGSLRRDEGGLERFAISFARAHAAGVRLDWDSLFAGAEAKPVALPTYPFQRERHWLGGERVSIAAEVTAGDPDQRQRQADRGPKGTWAKRLSALPSDAQEQFALELVAAEVASVLDQDSSRDVDADKTFEALGLESLDAVELRNRLRAVAEVSLPATCVFDYPTPAALAGFLLEQALRQGRRSQVPIAARPAFEEEPIAIVGMACRYPGGVGSPEQLWQVLAEGRDAIGPYPTDRGWSLNRLFPSDGENGSVSQALEAGFLDDAGDFDADFFGISPREAIATDPQQRLLLEVCWEALENVGLDPLSLRSTASGVFVGIGSQDYAAGLRSSEEETEGFRITGSLNSIASGRVAYSLGLEGPAITVDTACSSSLVAIHLAAGALRGGECDLALAGGATVLGTLGMFTEFARQGGLAPDGRCKSFSETADGTGWGEGVGVLALERLSDAKRNGHRVLATIRGSAVNQDGASNGLTAPNGPSQERVIRQALANARLSPQDIDAVEAHGTGTTLGDPIEAGALLATYGQERERPLRLGSIKSNIGHTQAAAGVAGVIKTVLAMREGVLPKTLHVDAPSSKVDWETGQIELLREAEPWQPNGRPRRAAVSSFGISGTNAHLILEEGPASGTGKTGTPGSGAGASSKDFDGTEALLPPEVTPLVLSAKSEPALRAQAERLAAHLSEHPELEPSDLAYSLAITRAAFEQRAVALAEDREQLLEALGALAAGREAPGLARGIARVKQGPAFLFGGQGAQHPGMGVDLLDSSPAFARHMRECEEALEPFVDFSLEEVLRDEEGSWLDRLDIVQPALFATMVSLARLWQDFGVRPSVLVGHSQGEIAAAHIAGGLSLEDAARIIAMRGKAMTALAGKGGMLAVSLSPRELEPRLEAFGGRLSLAAINGPASVVVSGDPEPLAELRAACLDDDVRVQLVAVDYAAHSAQIEALRGELLEAFEPISPGSGSIPFHSTVTGELLDTAELGPEYWYRNLRQTVCLQPVLASLLEQGRRAFIEVSPHPVLGFGLQETIDAFPESVQEAMVLGTLRREEGDLARFALSLAQAHAAGVGVDWPAVFKGTGAKAVPLPTYPFQRKRFWLAANTDASAGVGSAGQAPADHPLLGAVIESPENDGLALSGRISLRTHPWLADHAVAGTVLLPGTAFVELALRAGEEVDCEFLEELTLAAPLVLAEQSAVQLRVTLAEPDDRGRREISIHARPEREDDSALLSPGSWVRHAEGVLSPRAAIPEALGSWPPEGAEPIEVELFYHRLAEHGYEYGPAFQGLTAAWRAGEDLCAEVSLAEEQDEQAGRFAIHPALLDAALHAGVLGSAEEGSGQGPKLPFAWREVSIYRTGARRLRVRLRPEGEDGTSILIADDSGETVARIGSLALLPVATGELAGAARRPDPLLAVEWAEVALGGGAAPPYVLEGEDLDPLHAAIEAGAPVPGAVLYEPVQGNGDSSAQRARAAVEAGLGLIQGWLAAENFGGSRLVVLTKGAVAAADEDSPDPVAAALWGLLRSAQSEHPGRVSLIDRDGSEASLAALPAAAALEDEPQLALREGVALAPRVAMAALSEPSAGIDPERTTLITGGTGGLGSLIARHLVTEHSARHLLLASRSGEKAEGAKELAAELEELGAEVQIAACDVADKAQLEALLDSIPQAHPLGAVFHTAGVLDDATIESLGPEQLQRVLAPKADAAWALHELTADLDLSAFVLFSSIAGTFGGPGQGNYAAANSFLDALAGARHAQGLPATSIAWGLWESASGMTSHLGEADLARMRRSGLLALSDEQGLAFFDQALLAEVPQILAVPLDRAGLQGQASAGMLPAILRGLVRAPSRQRSAGGASLSTRLAALAEADREAFVLDLVRAQVAAVLGHGSAEAIDPERAFKELGFDSLAAVELRNRLKGATGLRLPATVVFDHPNSAALAVQIHALAARSDSGEDGGDEGSLASGFDRLEAMLAGLESDDRREEAATRLRAVLAGIDTEQDADLADASDEEMFELLDKKLGRI